MPPPEAPRSPGTYVLILRLGRTRHLEIGRLGRQRFPAGHYLYVGSARGPGGLAARLAHHWRTTDRPHWHIDHLRRGGPPVGAGIRAGAIALECRWAGRLAGLDVLEPGPAGFGSSDCRCLTHLFRLGDAAVAGREGLRALASRLGPVLSCDGWLDRRGRLVAGGDEAGRNPLWHRSDDDDHGP